MLSLKIPIAVGLPVAIFVSLSMGHPISSNVVIITSASFMLINKAPIYASSAKGTTWCRIYEIFNSVELCMFGLPASEQLPRKKCAPT